MTLEDGTGKPHRNVGTQLPTLMHNIPRVLSQMLYATVRSKVAVRFRQRYVDLVVSIEVAVEVCCCFTVSIC
jgi:hypothetical protein